MDKNPNAIQNIIIVGGGTAGWMSAAYLNQMLNTSVKNCDITLIEASDIPTVGVGEGSFPDIALFFKNLGVAEAEWMKACNATFKMAIKFPGWYDNSSEDSYWHTFGAPLRNKKNRVPLSHYWLKEKKAGYQVSFAKALKEHVQLCEANKSPRLPFEEQSSGISYAYHFDAGLLASFLKKIATEGGVNHLIGRVNKANLNQNGFIKSIDTNSHGILEGDLFLDCSGFSALLIGKTLKEPWISYSDSLFMDSAVAISGAYLSDDPYNERRGGLQPYTTSIAQKFGWSWNTPLITRDGNGYVYSSQFTDATYIEAEFRKFLGEKAINSTARHIKMRIGKFKRLWVKNCISIGLASGFIEPLEASGIALIQMGIENLLYNFPDKSFDKVLQDNYNKELSAQYENARDFVFLHYFLTQREDTPFWRAVKNETVIPDSLREQLSEWKHIWPNGNKTENLMYADFSYASILAGMKCFPEKMLPMLDFCGSGRGYFNKVVNRGAKLMKSHPTQAEYFKILYSDKYQAYGETKSKKETSLATMDSV